MKKYILVAIAFIVVIKISYPLFLREQAVWVLNNTTFSQKLIAGLQQVGLYDKYEKV